MMQWMLVFSLTFVMDVSYAFYTAYVVKRWAHMASTAAVLIYAFAGLAVILFNKDPLLLIPGCAGAYCGTFVVVKWGK